MGGRGRKILGRKLEGKTGTTCSYFITTHRLSYIPMPNTGLAPRMFPCIWARSPASHLTRIIRGRDERAVFKAVFEGVMGRAGKPRKGGRSLKAVFLAKALPDGTSGLILGAPFLRVRENSWGEKISRGWPGGFAAPGPAGRGKDNLRPGEPRCGGWSPGYGPRFSGA
jgi:hypothetical protein